VLAALVLPVGLFSIEAAAILGLLVTFPADLVQRRADRTHAVITSAGRGPTPA
jgi:hypothetical protein